MDDLNDNSSKTTFYVESLPDRIKRFAWLIIVIALVIGGIVIWSRIGSGARSAMDHAKDIRLAMKMVAVEYYGGKRSIYDPSTESGMTDEALAKIGNVVPIKGEIVLTGWDDEKNIPLSFTYREGRYLVEYRDIGTGDGTYGMNGDWSVYYNFKVLEYTAGD
ncbi:MAG: hypothetical protein J5696_11035 [Lachnospiraceae bacterium]|nr:hypothetical protein [Lachnospiraceae bacterium]